MSQMRVRIADYEAHAPPEKVLRVSQVGDLVFLVIEKADSDEKGETYSKIAEVGVDHQSLLHALVAVHVDDAATVRRASTTEEQSDA